MSKSKTDGKEELKVFQTHHLVVIVMCHLFNDHLLSSYVINVDVLMCEHSIILVLYTEYTLVSEIYVYIFLSNR